MFALNSKLRKTVKKLYSKIAPLPDSVLTEKNKDDGKEIIAAIFDTLAVGCFVCINYIQTFLI